MITRIDASRGVPVPLGSGGVPSGNSVGDVAFVPGKGTILVQDSGYAQRQGLDEYRLSDLKVIGNREMAVYRGRALATTPARGGLLAVASGGTIDVGRFDRANASETQIENVGKGIAAR